MIHRRAIVFFLFFYVFLEDRSTVRSCGRNEYYFFRKGETEMTPSGPKKKSYTHKQSPVAVGLNRK